MYSIPKNLEIKYKIEKKSDRKKDKQKKNTDLDITDHKNHKTGMKCF